MNQPKATPSIKAVADLATPMAIRVAATLSLVERAGTAGATVDHLAAETSTEPTVLAACWIISSPLAKTYELGYIKLEPDNTDELIDSLNAVGDSHLWSQSPDHGSSDQRVAWFTKGFNGDIESCLGQR